NSKEGKRQPKTRKRSTKIDMTAMVDVAFLLLTFFVLTATMSKVGVKEMMKPPKDLHAKKLIEDRILTVVLDDMDQVMYYRGITDVDVRTTDFSASGIRQVMQEFQSSRPDLPYCTSVNNEGLEDGKCWDPIIMVKAKSGSRYRNLVDVIDEISLLNLKYALGQFTSADSLLIEEASVHNDNHDLAELQIQ
ncbi:MAG: biopolymer transporter ExbD, partial [Bacteroidota bacterium]